MQEINDAKAYRGYFYYLQSSRGWVIEDRGEEYPVIQKKGFSLNPLILVLPASCTEDDVRQAIDRLEYGASSFLE